MQVTDVDWSVRHLSQFGFFSHFSRRIHAYVSLLKTRQQKPPDEWLTTILASNFTKY